MAWLKLLRYPKSLRWRYSLRALLIFITLFMLWGGYHSNRSWKERAAEDILRSRNATFVYGPPATSPGLLGMLQSKYNTLIQLIWRERFIARVDLCGALDQDVVAALCVLPHLESLGLEPHQVSESERRQLSKEIASARPTMPEGALPRILKARTLTSLRLAQWSLSDEDCKAISTEVALVELTILESQISEEGFVQVITLPRLVQFSHSDSDVTGDGLIASPGSPSLESVYCARVPLGRGFATYMSRCNKLQALTVGHQSIDDRFVPWLGAHASLTHLALGGQITDKTVMALAKLPSLQSVALPRERITAGAITSLQKANPAVIVRP